MASPTTPIEQHPDLVELRMRYDEVAQKPAAQFLEGLTFLVGIFLAASPWIVGFAGLAPLAANNFIVGGALALLAIGFASAYGRTHGIAWVAPCLGLWTIVAPWMVVGDVATARSITSNVITGILALVLGLATTLLGTRGAALKSRVSRRR